MKQVSCLSNTELWYSYGEPRVARDNQAAAAGADYSEDCLSDSSNPPRLDWVNLGS